MNHNVTPIEMLPELDDLESGRVGQRVTNINENMNSPTYTGASMLPPAEAEKYGKFLRGNYAPPQQSGMESYQEEYLQTPPAKYFGTPVDDNHDNNVTVTQFQMPVGSPSCLEVASHIANCPICSKFYNNDRTLYIISIVILAFVCLLLLKRVLDV